MGSESPVVIIPAVTITVIIIPVEPALSIQFADADIAETVDQDPYVIPAKVKRFGSDQSFPSFKIAPSHFKHLNRVEAFVKMGDPDTVVVAEIRSAVNNDLVVFHAVNRHNWSSVGRHNGYRQQQAGYECKHLFHGTQILSDVQQWPGGLMYGLRFITRLHLVFQSKCQCAKKG